MYPYLVGGLGEFNYLKKFSEARLSSSDGYKFGAQGELNPHPERRVVCLGHNKGSESSKRRECLGFYSAGADRVCGRHALLPVRAHG